MRMFATLILALILPAHALEDADPPARVGRLAWTQGEVAAWLDPERGWEKAYVNTPVTSENSLWTESGARAELRVGSTTLRIDATTQLDLRRLDDEQLRAHVVNGTLALRIRHFERGEQYVVSTPQTRFFVTGIGRYRIDVRDDQGLSRLTVFEGSALYESQGRRSALRAGQAVVLYGTDDAQLERAAAADFDHWALSRDDRLAEGQATRYVSPRMTGYEELDRHGEWSPEPEYGTLWYPSGVGADWAPYRQGHWAWLRPWGWTWIDDAPWGYAPFHYGRWVHTGHRWGWYPGRYVARPVWAPALVGWVGGAGWSVSISTRNAPVVGWYPLAPWDRYQPWYSARPRHVTNVNVNVIARPPRIDARHPDSNRGRGTTVVLRDGFVSRRPVSEVRAPVSREAIAAQPLSQGASILPPRQEMPRGHLVWPGPAQGTTPANRAPSGSRPGATPVAPSAPSAPVTISAPQPARSQPGAVPAAPRPGSVPWTSTTPSAPRAPNAEAATRSPRPTPINPATFETAPAPAAVPAPRAQPVAKPGGGAATVDPTPRPVPKPVPVETEKPKPDKPEGDVPKGPRVQKD